MLFKNILKNDKIKSLIAESWTLSWPMTFIMLFEFVIGLSDVYVASRLSKEILAAYGLAFQLYFVFIFVGIAISIGSVSIISRLFSSGRKDEFSLAISTSLGISCIAGIIFGIAGFALAAPVIRLFNIPDSLKTAAIPLLRIYSIGFLFDYILINLNGILRSSGKIKSSLLAMTVACILNVALNFILAFGTPLKFSGIAWATVISLFVGAVIAAVYTKPLMQRWSGISIDMIKRIVSISWPSGVLQIVWQAGAVALFFILSILPAYNVEVIAAFTNGLKIESAIFLPAFAFNMAAAVIVGNLLGKNQKEDAFKGGIITALLGVCLVTIATLLIMLNARTVASFLSTDKMVINESIKYIYVALICEPIMAWSVILGGGLNGAGDTKGVMIITALGVWLVRLPLAYVFGIYFGLGQTAVWWCMNASIIVQAILITKRYFARQWLVAA